MVQLVNTDLAAKRIPMNTEEPRSARLISIGAVEHALDKFLLELVDRFIKHDASLDHLTDQRFQLIFHSPTLPQELVIVAIPPSGQFNAYQEAIGFAVLGPSLLYYFRRQWGAGRQFVPPNTLQVVTDILLIK